MKLRFYPMEIVIIPKRPTSEEEPVSEDWQPTHFVAKGRWGDREVITLECKSPEEAARTAIILLKI